MKLNKLWGLTFVSLFVTNAANAQQPYTGCWHPDDITNWSPQTDKDAKFNRSRVPLAKRFKEPKLMKANKNQYYEGQVCNSTILFPMCSQSPSQGANNFVGYQPTYWQYMDKLVYWAGSASEGIICPPPAGSIDAAHQSGVKVLGQIFFPPAAFGGISSWVSQMLSKPGGKYIYAKKLYEIAKYFGFDGWFINEEITHSAYADQWAEFIKEFNSYADADGQTQMEIQWYAATGIPAVGILKSHKNTSQFLEYGSVGDYRKYAAQLGCTEEETFSKIYGGIQTVYSGMTGYGGALRQAFPKKGHVGSVDLFCPEERIWKDQVKDILGTTNNQGTLAHAKMKNVFNNEDIVWVNRSKDPSVEGDIEGNYSNWPGMSGCILERSVITSMPFTTSFCVGIGKHRFVKGVKKNTQDWWNSGVQSIMPTWRWWIEQKLSLAGSIDWDDAYNFGNSVKISGQITKGNHLMRLYKTMIPVKDGGEFKLVYKTSLAGSVEVKLGTESTVKDSAMVTLSNVTRTTENGWIVDKYDLKELNGKTVYMIALNLKSEANKQDYSLSLGELSMLPANYAPKALEIKNLKNETTLNEETGDLRLTWDWDDNADFDHFDVYTITADNQEHLVGQTRGEGFYVPKFKRNGTDKELNVRVVPIMKDGTEGAKQMVKAEYPKLTAPVINVKPSKSYVKVGDEITLTAKATGSPTAWKWILPEGVQLASSGSLETSTIKVKATKEGKPEIKVEATNEAGVGTKTVVAFDVMPEADFKDVKNVAINKDIASVSGYTNWKETPKNIVDGIDRPNQTYQKWCNIAANHECVIDLKSTYRIYGFDIFDCKSGPENNENFDKYRISVSQDGKNWNLVVDETGREKENIKKDAITPTNARYIKLNPYSDEGFTLRIWEFKVYGTSLSNLVLTAPKGATTFEPGETKNIELNFNLGGEKPINFFVETTVVSGNVTLGMAKSYQETGKIVVPVTAGTKAGKAVVKVIVSNGGISKEATFTIVVDDPNAVNVLKGMSCKMRQYGSDYAIGMPYSQYTFSELTDGDKDVPDFEDIDNPCKYKQDLWFVFEGQKQWNLSKVKIYIPKGNMDESDNEEKGFANKNIDIMISDNGQDWKTIHTFEDIKEVNELSYVLPQAKKTQYLAIVATMHPYFFPLISEVEAFEQAEPKSTTKIAPVKVASGWNEDVIAEAKPSQSHATANLDDQGWVFYTTKLSNKGALCKEDGMIKVSSGHEYQLADFTKKNALKLDMFEGEIDIKFEKPIQVSELFILGISTNGTSRLTAKPIYENNEVGASMSFQIADWFGNAYGTALSGLGRIKRGYKDGYNSDQFDTQYNFRLFENIVKADKTKKMIGVRLASGSSATPTILGFSAEQTVEEVETGISNITTNGATIEAIFDADGKQINQLAKGVNIVRYSNGKVVKVLKR